MLGIAINALDEVTRLLQFNEPLWIKDPAEGRYVLDHERYTRIFRKPNLNSFHAWFESSKDEGLVRMAGKQLVDVILDADKWMDFFPTIVTKAKTIVELESGTPEIRHGYLKLMYEKMHVLSPLVAPREFYFLRYCQQINEGVWVIVDVSYDCFSEENQHPSPCCSWRLPSGCMIQDYSNGWSKVTWMEHIQVDETTTHRLYRDFVRSGSAYGAERWLVTLQRTSERFAYSMMEHCPSQTLGDRRSIMNLTQRMVKNLCACLAMNGQEEFPHISESIQESIPGQPDGIVVTATTSFWLPLPFQRVIEFLKDNNRRAEWDVFSGGRPVQEVTKISYGSHLQNCISVIQPYQPNETNLVMLQETFMDPLGALLVYAPIDTATFNIAISAEEYSSNIPILPSGFIISSDARFENVGSDGSLITLAYQILIRDLSSPIGQQSVANFHALISSTVQTIKVALNCSGFD